MQQENSTKLHFLERFDALRHAYGLTEEAMAERLGYSRYTIQKIRSDEILPSRKLLMRLKYAEAAKGEGMNIKWEGAAVEAAADKRRSMAMQLRAIADELDPPITRPVSAHEKQFALEALKAAEEPDGEIAAGLPQDTPGEVLKAAEPIKAFRHETDKRKTRRRRRS